MSELIDIGTTEINLFDLIDIIESQVCKVLREYEFSDEYMELVKQDNNYIPYMKIKRFKFNLQFIFSELLNCEPLDRVEYMIDQAYISAKYKIDKLINNVESKYICSHLFQCLKIEDIWTRIELL